MSKRIQRALTLSGVEASGDDDEGRRELVRDGQQQVVEGGQVVGIAHPAAVPRHVHRRAGAGAAPHLASGAGAGVEGPPVVAVQAGVHDSRVVFQYMLRPVAVVYVLRMERTLMVTNLTGDNETDDR